MPRVVDQHAVVGLRRLREVVEGPHDLALLGVPEQGDLREAVLGTQKPCHRLAALQNGNSP